MTVKEGNMTMNYKSLIIAALGLTLSAGAALAEVAALGSTQRGGTSQIGRALSAAISEGSDLQMRPQEMANTADYIPLVNNGELEFGISNIVQLKHAVTGTGMSEGRKNDNLLMAATLMPFRVGYIVRKDSDIADIPALKGKRVPVFSEGSLGQFVTRAFLANAELTPEDVDGVAVPNFPRMWNSFSEGSTDVTIVVVGAANSREFDATFGIRYLSFDSDPAAVERIRSLLPESYLQELTPDSGIPGIETPVDVVVYDYTFFASAEASDDMVYRAVKALYEKEQDLLASSPFWLGFQKDGMAKDVGVEYHPGAIKFYKEMGIWQD